jgi:hypothetical protein
MLVLVVSSEEGKALSPAICTSTPPSLFTPLLTLLPMLEEVTWSSVVGSGQAGSFKAMSSLPADNTALGMVLSTIASRQVCARHSLALITRALDSRVSSAWSCAGGEAGETWPQ